VNHDIEKSLEEVAVK
jgi:hypothetical protein